MKTSISKKFKITKNKKLMHHRGGQDHFNAKNPGKITRKKRKNKPLSKSLSKTIKRYI